MTNKYRWIHCAECGGNRLHAAHGLCLKCYKRQWYEDNPEYFPQRREANPDKVRETGRRWRKAHPENYSEYKRQWNEANPDKARAMQTRRRARKNGATIGPVDEAAIYERDGYMCIYCGETHRKLTIDHIEALSNGGPHLEDNLLVACGRCNSSKGTKPFEEWLQTQPKALAWVI